MSMHGTKFLVTDTVDGPDSARGTDDWPETLGKFLRFNIFMENKDTRGIGGDMKDTRRPAMGIWVVVFKQPVKKLAGLNGRLIGIKIGDFCYVKEGLSLGQLQGNQFTITLRICLLLVDAHMVLSSDEADELTLIRICVPAHCPITEILEEEVSKHGKTLMSRRVQVYQQRLFKHEWDAAVEQI
ncbi:hypothetical protein MKW98_026758 [Papaver atlanticum]|uniref:Uncharacterized protein n=1 Tax=Papaver atlanticum TaxID=357466 RepID=A0AAD4X6T6_9MAGN|nr:hypothetical protein MKW98_026758 [Papaver atlanticum]